MEVVNISRIPSELQININTVVNDIHELVIEYCNINNIDFYDIKSRTKLPTNEVNRLCRYIYNRLFKPNITLQSHQKSLLDYDNIELLTVIAECFLDICLTFNTPLSLRAFTWFSGIDDNTLLRWESEEGKIANPARWEIVKYIRFNNAELLASKGRDLPIGIVQQLNCNKEYGFMWSQQNAQQITNNQIYLLSSEKAQSLNLRALQGDSTKKLETVED